jgi:hypothetical protein
MPIDHTGSLTLPQRFQFEVFGYVLLEGLLKPAEVERLKATIYRMRDDPDRGEKGVYAITKGRSYYIRMGNLVQYDPVFVQFATHPKIVPLAEELVGGSVRLEENETIINRRNPEADIDELRRSWPNPTRIHRAIDPSWGCYVEGGHFHTLFVKAIAYLTDVGPEDGGTCVIPGSHRTIWPRSAIESAAQMDTRLYQCIEGRAGSVLLFSESLLHSTSEIISDNERVVVTSGYTPPMFRMERGNFIRPAFVASLPEEVRPLISGSQRWEWKRRYE